MRLWVCVWILKLLKLLKWVGVFCMMCVWWVVFWDGWIRAPTRDAPTVYVCFDLFFVCWCMVSVGAGSACPKPHARNRPNGYDICWCIRFFIRLCILFFIRWCIRAGRPRPYGGCLCFVGASLVGARIHPPNTYTVGAGSACPYTSPVYIHQKHPYAISQQTTCLSFTVPPNVGRWLAPLGWNNICVGGCNSWPSVPPGAWDIPLSIGRGSSWRFAVGCSDNRAWQVLTCRKYVL